MNKQNNKQAPKMRTQRNTTSKNNGRTEVGTVICKTPSQSFKLRVFQVDGLLSYVLYNQNYSQRHSLGNIQFYSEGDQLPTFAGKTNAQTLSAVRVALSGTTHKPA